MNQTFVLGTGRCTITPPLGTPLYGYSNRREAVSVNDDLHVTVAAVGYGKASAALVNDDLCSVPATLAAELQGIISEKTGISRDHIILSCTHTHSGPCLTTIPGWGDADTDYIENKFIPATLEALQEAIERVVPVRMGVGTTQSDVGINRRELNRAGEVLLGQNPYGLYDPTMTVLSFIAEDGTTVANIVHYGCHGTSAGIDPIITRDWPGYMVDRMEEITGATTLFFNGAEGDVGPRLSNGKTTGDISHTRELGARAATDAVRAYRTIKEYNEVSFRVAVDTIAIPYRKMASLESLRADAEAFGDPTGLTGFYKLKYKTLTERIRLLESGETLETHRYSPQTLFAFNSVVLVPFPYEMFVEITRRLRVYSPFQHTLSICNTNGAYAYLPSRDQICRGGYEVMQFLDRNPYALVDDADDHIINENLRIMEKL